LLEHQIELLSQGMDALKIGVVGNGSWATALVKILCDNAVPKIISWHLKNDEDVQFVEQNKHNPRYLTDVAFDLSKIELNASLLKVIEQSDVVLVAVPSAFLDDLLQQCPADSFKNKIIISAVKGVNSKTHQIISPYFQSVWQVPAAQMLAVSGPCHAEEVAMEKLSYLTLASENETLATQMAALFNNKYILTKTTNDIYGIEYAAVLKNVYAIACGICHGLGYGDNFQAVLVSASIREIECFLNASHQYHRDVKDNAYLGDLLVTAYSQFSRNRTFGNMLGKGYSVKSAQMEMNMIAEGFFATRTMHEINSEHNAVMPILNAVYDIIYNNHQPKKRIESLLVELI